MKADMLCPRTLLKQNFQLLAKFTQLPANDGSQVLMSKVLTHSQHKIHCLYKLEEQLLPFIKNKRFQDF